jgi:glycoside hydrolase-like protein
MIALASVPATPGAKGVDCVTVLDAGHCAALVAAGVSFAGRYLGHISAAELDAIVSAGLQCTFVAGYSRAPGWVPTEAEGQADGASAVAHALALGLPAGVTIWLDLETWLGGDPEGWVNAAAKVIQAAGFQAGLYVGYDDVPLSPAALYALAVTRYWKSCSRGPVPATRGFCMVQNSPNTWVAGVQVDANVVQDDTLGDVPTFAGTAPAAIA